MKTRVLFVDDEIRIIEGLRRSLRNMQQEWEMSFVGSGQEALDTLNQKPFDVVVSDMRMPGIDGAQLLAEVKESFPQTARIILSGHSEQKFIMKSVPIAHQYLAKPCDVETLKSVIIRACKMRSLLADDSIKRIIATINTLPSLPPLYVEIMEELQSPGVSIQKIANIVSKDIGMTAKILQLVNSAFFGLQQHVSSPSQAVTLLGIETIKALVLSVHIFSHFDSQTKPPILLERIWNHSFLTGILAKAIAKGENQKQIVIDDSFTAGLLHDVGKLILSVYIPEQYHEVQEKAKSRKISLWEAEKETFGVTHCEVGAYLIGLWGLPDPIVEALTFHHDPAACPAEEFSPLLALHMANALEQVQSDIPEVRSQINRDYLSKLNMLPRLPIWEENCRKVISGGEANA
ncbi:MAG TPA: response regulator [Thermodesulfobacteriota bacterium]|nr:response regulator [Thermodesulfobacteriota bacterium]